MQYVYLLRGDSGFYKIGISQNVESRLRHLNTSNPDHLSIVTAKIVEDAPALERKLHDEYAACRTKTDGEWFRLTPEDALKVCVEIHQTKSAVDDSVTDVQKLSRQLLSLRRDLMADIATVKMGVREVFKRGSGAKLHGSVPSVVKRLRVRTTPDDTELQEKAKVLIRQFNTASASFLQRRLYIGYSRAARIMDRLEDEGFVSAGYPRTVLVNGMADKSLHREVTSSLSD